MLKKTITYTDYNGKERTEDFYFNFSKAEIAEMESSYYGGFAAKLEAIVKEENPKQLVEHFKEIIFKAYGEKSEDGRRFIKSRELSEAFSQTEAYSNLFMELASNAEAAAIFVNGIVPEIPNK